MPTRKRKTKSGITWGFYFDAPGSTRTQRQQIIKWGFRTQREAIEAEAQRRIEASRESELRQAGVTAPLPRTLADLLREFCSEYASRNLAPKTVERYQEQIRYLSPELVVMPIDELTPVHFTREWGRLRESGGHVRKTGAVRELSAKTVRNIASFVSSAYKQAVSWGIAKRNPVADSGKPRVAEKQAIALSPDQERLLVEGSLHWCLPDLLEVASGLGVRRGEALALRWSDIKDDVAFVQRSLSQTKAGLHFKETKSRSGLRPITIPESTLAVLARIREKQAEFRAQFGPDYRADLDLVLCNPDGTPLKPDSISGSVSNLMRKMKMPKGASLHTFRHSHGSLLLAGGMELPAVSARLGHSSPSVTAKIYSHILSGRDRESAKVWEKMRGTPPIHHHAKTEASSTEKGSPGRTENERVKPN